MSDEDDDATMRSQRMQEKLWAERNQAERRMRELESLFAELVPLETIPLKNMRPSAGAYEMGFGPRVFEKEGVENLHNQIIFHQVIIVTGSVDQSINIGPRMQGDIINSTLTNTLTAINNFAQSGAKPELASELQKLAAHTEELIKQLPTDKAKADAASDLQTLTKEATNEAPRKKWYELSGEGLIEAAKTVATMAGPITETVKKIMEMLGTASSA